MTITLFACTFEVLFSSYVFVTCLTRFCLYTGVTGGQVEELWSLDDEHFDNLRYLNNLRDITYLLIHFKYPLNLLVIP